MPPVHSIRRCLTLLAAFAAIASAVSCSGRPEYVKIEGYAQGGTYSVICKVPQGISRDFTRARIDSILTAVDNSLSGYNKGSLLSRVNRGEEIPLDPIFVRCLQRSAEVWQESLGAFDPSAAPLFDLWGFGFEQGGNPLPEEVNAAMESVGLDKFSIIRKDGELYLDKPAPAAKLNFNAIAQGLSCDLVAEELESEGCRDYLVEVGREMMCRGQRQGGGPWHIGIDKPADNAGEYLSVQDIVDVTDKGIVTSGNYRKFYIRDGRKYSHTIDPRTGYPVEHNLLSATVIADDATTADAYATWFMVVGLDRAAEIVGSRDDIEAYLVYGDQEDMKVWKSPGFKTEQNN